jgi:hypothetical protein
MSIKPIDLQVNIGQLGNIARIQHGEQIQGALNQANQAQHLAKQSDVQAHTVNQPAQPENRDSQVNDRKERRRWKEKINRRDDGSDEVAVVDDAGQPEDDGEKGHLVDTLQ